MIHNILWEFIFILVVWGDTLTGELNYAQVGCLSQFLFRCWCILPQLRPKAESSSHLEL